MRRVGNLWEGLLSWENLYRAVHKAARGKRKRPDVAAFLLNLEPETICLRRELESGSYIPGPYNTFIVREPKMRLISAAPFRDRVIHHAVTQILEPIFERRFTRDSYACRIGFGAHRALARVSAACARFPYVLKCDVRKYFPSIDHAILLEQIERVVKCAPTLALVAKIVEGSNPQEDVTSYFPGDDLFTPFERRRGLPLGNQTSQFFANAYLNPLDHFVARELKPAAYARYVDDFVLFGDDKRELGIWRDRIDEFLAGFRLRLHERKSHAYDVRDGLTFLGWRVFPEKMRLSRQNVIRARRRLKKAAADYHAGRLEFEDFRSGVMAWLGHAMHGDTRRIRESVLEQVILRPAVHCLHRLARGVLEQQSTERSRVEP